MQDLGAIDEPLLIFGGPYGNLEAMQALCVEIERLEIPADRLLCTGDLVAYCAEPQETVDLVRRLGAAVVMGNCEESLAVNADNCGCGFSEESQCNILSAKWYAYCLAELDDATQQWMGGLPRSISFSMMGKRLLAIHGGVHEINRFIFPATPALEKNKEIDTAGFDGIIGGHSGLPFTEILDGRLWHNSGALGMPANDATPRVWYSLMTPTADGIEISHHALTYDHGAAARRVRARDLPAAYADTLESGLWPSDDVMPEADRARRGIAIDLQTSLWRDDASFLTETGSAGVEVLGAVLDGFVSNA